MQNGDWNGMIWRTLITAALFVGLAQAKAIAQQNDWTQIGATATDARVAPTSNEPLLSDIERRLAALEAAHHLADDDLGNCEQCVEVDIQTKPNHQIIGRMFFDQLWMDDLTGAILQPLQNQTGFRDLRLGVQGNIWENLAYKVEFEFEGDEVDFKDVYAELQNLCYLGNFRIGHFKEPMGLEELTDGRFTTFMERSTPIRDFAPDRNIGIMLYNDVLDNPNNSWYVSFTRGGSNLDNANTVIPGLPPDEDVDHDTSDWAITGRLVALPYYDEATPGRCLVHLGVSGSHRRTGEFPGNDGNGHWTGLLELDDRQSLLNIQLNPREEFSVVGAEAAWVRGPLSIQGEYIYAATGDATGVNAWGAYGQLSYFITGENRGYDRRMKAFGRVRPYEPFFLVHTCDGCAAGLGAWEVAARWSWTDLESIVAFPPVTTGPTVIGMQENITVGVNWYLNPYSRMMFNYVHSITNYTFLGKSEGDHFGLRFQIDW